MTQSEALRLADALSAYCTPQDVSEQAAAELRLLHEANEAFGKRQEWWNERMFVLEQQRDALMEFAKYVEAIDPGNPAPLFEKAREAIKKAEGV